MSSKSQAVSSVAVKAGSTGGMSFSGLAGISAFAYSAITTPVFIGAAGLGMAALVGVATFAGGAIGAIAGIIGGVVVGGAALGGLGLIFARRMEVALPLGALGAIGGLCVGGLVGFGAGIYKGYTLSQTALEEKACAVPFNDAVAQKCKEMGLTIAPKGSAPVSSPVR